ncbi:MAG: hypothetical protein QW561_01725 [Candidatus Aenigmatarchaeota archaeon]
MVLKKEQRTVILSLLAVIAMGAIQVAQAVNTPTAGTFAYDLYDIGVNKIVRGPIGFVGGVVAMVAGAIAAIQAKIMLALPAILGGAALLKADSIVTSLGAII